MSQRTPARWALTAIAGLCLALFAGSVADAHWRARAHPPRRVVVVRQPRPVKNVVVVNGERRGLVDLNVKPRATEVWVDGQYKGTCDAWDGHPDKLRLTAGVHRLRFLTPDGEPLPHYDFVTSLILTPGQKERPDVVSRAWHGDVPKFGDIRWVGGEFAARPRPYLRQGASEIDADAAFREQFRDAVDESVTREANDRRSADPGGEI